MSNLNHITASGVSKAFESNGAALIALQDLDLTVQRGEFLSIIGPSGCGKTTLLNIVGGLVDPTEGRIKIGDLSPMQAQKRKEIGFVFQDPGLLPWRTVLGNVRLPLHVNSKNQQQALGSPEHLVETVGLAKFSDYYPHQLSGGMKQRVALARALVFNPALLLMDEPLGALDEITRSLMRYELLKIWDSSQKTVVMITHSVVEAVIMSDRVAVMSGLPGSINKIINIDIPRPRDAQGERSTPFLHYVNQVKDALAHHDTPTTPSTESRN